VTIVSEHHTQFAIVSIGLAVALFVGMFAFLEVGRRIGLRQLARYGEEGLTGVGKADAPVYGLLALLVGFVFSGAAGRFDHRRELIAQQVNAIGTGWIRIDALPPSDQIVVRNGFRNYLDALLATYAGEHEGGTDVLIEAPTVEHARRTLWADAMAACLAPEGEKARMLLLPALNEMFDVVEDERLARWVHPPMLIYVMLGVAALASALFAGIALSKAPPRTAWVYMIGIAATIAVALFVTIELEYPRRGLVRIDEMDQALVDVRASMK
jgi:hypothetical protein